MKFFDFPQFDAHEHLNIFHDHESGLNAIVAIHRRGKKFAVGGTRMKNYLNFDAALDDALRLSKAMTYKLALAGIPLGGGKSVIIGDPGKDKSPEILAAFGSCIDSLQGAYCCAPDVGTSASDMLEIRNSTPYVRGIQNETGDSSLDTAIGVFHAIRAAMKHRFSKDNLQGVRIAIQGAGNVGSHLHAMLKREGTELIIADVNNERTAALNQDGQTSVVGIEEILLQDVDIVAPCALGNVISKDVIDKMKAVIICGAANNQLIDNEVAGYLNQKNILYVPDYVANAGGVIGGCRIDCDYSEEEAMSRIERIHDTCLTIFEQSTTQGKPTPEIVNTIAESRIKDLL